MQIEDIKIKLRKLGAKTTGNKAELLKRLQLWEKHKLEDVLVPFSVITPTKIFSFPDENLFKPISEVKAKYLNISEIEAWFHERKAQIGLINGRILAMKLFVKRTSVFAENSITFFKSLVAAEQKKNKDYMVKLVVDKSNNNIELCQATCTCPAGQGWSASCKHIAAVCFSIEYFSVTGKLQEYVSCTSKLATWNKPGRCVKPMSIYDITNQPKVEIQFDKKISEEFANRLINVGLNNSPLLENRRVNPSGFLNDHAHYTHLYCSQFLDNINKVTVVKRSVYEEKTKKQSKSKLWETLRRSRITGSIIGDVCRTVRSKKFSMHPALKNIVLNKRLKFLKAVKWGLANEDTAKELYEKIMNIKIQQSGMWIHHIHNFLASSPDGHSFPLNVVLEIKCPFSIKDESPLNAKYIVKDKFLGSSHLNRNHAYYAQCQLHMYVTNIDYCDFIVWTTKGIYIESIRADSRFQEKMVKDARLYYDEVFAQEYMKYYMLR